jgi:hypothetical protein
MVKKAYPQQKEYPLWFHSRKGESDKKFILDRMFFIPEHLKHEVSDQYERLYQSQVDGFRKKANEYLHNEAIKHKDKVSSKAPPKVQSYLQNKLKSQ